MRNVAIALDESQESRRCLDWAAQCFLRRATDMVHLLTVLPPMPTGALSVPPPGLGVGGSTVAVINVQQQRQQEQADAQRSLKLAAELLNADYHIPSENISSHILPAAGGASGVAESIVEFSKSRKADVLIIGQRGMSFMKRALMSFVGLGSVSEYCMHKGACPVVVVRSEPGREPQPCVEALPLTSLQPPKHVLVAVEDSPYSTKAMTWALDNLLQPQDHLHVVTVAAPIPYPILDEPAAVAAAEKQQYDQEASQAAGYSQTLVSRAVETAQAHGVMKSHIKSSVLQPAGGGSDIGSAIIKYARDSNVDVVVTGSRGMGAVKRSLMAVVGLGSVTDFLARNTPCSLAVVRDDVQLSQTGVEESGLMAPIDEAAEGEGTSRTESGAAPEPEPKGPEPK